MIGTWISILTGAAILSTFAGRTKEVVMAKNAMRTAKEKKKPKAEVGKKKKAAPLASAAKKA